MVLIDENIKQKVIWAYVVRNIRKLLFNDRILEHLDYMVKIPKLGKEVYLLMSLVESEDREREQ